MEFLDTYSLTMLVFAGFALIGLGAFAGFLAGLLGVGGGIVLVPGLFYVFTFLGFESPYLMHIAVGTSLAIIVPTGFSSARAHWKKDAVDMGIVRTLGVGIVIGVILGTLLISGLSGVALKMIFATALLIFAVLMLSNTTKVQVFDGIPPQPWASAAGGFIGFISTLIGIGGATLSVPFMTFCKVPIHRAIGTAAALGLVISVPASLGSIVVGWDAEGRLPFSLGFVNVAAWAFIIPVSVMVAPLGAMAAHRLPVRILKRGFAVFMIFVALRMWYGLL